MLLKVIPGTYSVVRFAADTPIPEWALNSNGFFSITRTDEELSIVCQQEFVQSDGQVESDWAAIKVEGPLDFSLTGILVRLAEPLAKNEISIFAISTYDTDYLLVKKVKLDQAIEVLRNEGHEIAV